MKSVVFLFSFQPFKFKSSFSRPLPDGEEVKSPNWTWRAGQVSPPAGSVPPWFSVASAGMWLSAAAHALRSSGASSQRRHQEKFHKKKTSRPRFYTELHQFIKGNLGESRKKKKGNIFFTETSNSMFLKGESRIHIETDAQEIKLYFVAESLSSELLMHGVPETTQNGRA